MENTNIGFVNLNDQYRLNTSKSKRIGEIFNEIGGDLGDIGSGFRKVEIGLV